MVRSKLYSTISKSPLLPSTQEFLVSLSIKLAFTRSSEALQGALRDSSMRQATRGRKDDGWACKYESFRAATQIVEAHSVPLASGHPSW